MPDEQPSIVNFLLDLFMLMVLGAISFAPVFVVFILLGLLWEVCTH